MGLFSFLFGNNQNTESSLSITSSTDIDYYTPKYYKILESRPNLFKIQGRAFDFPKYSDTFKTQENYSLRELLLLIWWGKPKTGRKSTVTIPKYFFSTYNLNAEKLTRQFRDKGLIIDSNNKTILTDKGQQIADKYKALWEIHSIKNYPTNLDIDFPTWDKDTFDLKLNQMNMTYYSAHAKFCQKMIDYLNTLNAPASAQEIHNEINYYINEKNSNLLKVNDLKEKIAILQEKISEKQE